MALNEDTSKTKLIIDSSFISRLFKEELILQRFKAIYNSSQIINEPRPNEYHPEKIDTLKSFYVDGDSISFYTTQTKSVPYKIVITSTKITLDGDIRIGVKKDVIHKHFRIDQIPDILMVEDVAGFSRFTFYFSDDRLSKITFQFVR